MDTGALFGILLGFAILMVGSAVGLYLSGKKIAWAGIGLGFVGMMAALLSLVYYVVIKPVFLSSEPASTVKGEASSVVAPAPTPVATLIHTQPGSSILINDVKMGDTSEQPYIAHPHLYLSTGIDSTVEWTVEAPTGSVIIVGGYEVNKHKNGFYQAVLGGDEVTFEITNGFLLVTSAEWGHAEWCFRLGEVKAYNWALSEAHPLSSWPACGK